MLLKPHAQLIGFPGHYLRHGMAAEQADIKIALTNTDEYRRIQTNTDEYGRIQTKYSLWWRLSDDNLKTLEK